MNQLRTIVTNLVACMVLLAFVGCGSIIHGPDKRIVIHSSPEGANLEIENRSGKVVEKGETPMRVWLERKEDYFASAHYKVHLSRKGYQDRTVEITGQISPWYVVGNVIFLQAAVLAWFIVDPLTGGMWELRPSKIDASLQEGTTYQETDEGLILYVPMEENNQE